MKLKKEDIPVIMEGPGMVMRSLSGLGDMTVVFHELPKGTDFTPLLKGLHNDKCHCPHWGYIFEGMFRFIYEDGRQESFDAGDVFYAPPCHTAIVDKDLKFIDFSPTKELNEVMTNVGKVMAEMA
tara:strand:+ start:2272 stop:2646 length:375 start_codon:yes stop_codon:yes gene_type:complete